MSCLWLSYIDLCEVDLLSVQPSAQRGKEVLLLHGGAGVKPLLLFTAILNKAGKIKQPVSLPHVRTFLQTAGSFSKTFFDGASNLCVTDCQTAPREILLAQISCFPVKGLASCTVQDSHGQLVFPVCSAGSPDRPVCAFVTPRTAEPVSPLSRPGSWSYSLDETSMSGS